MAAKLGFIGAGAVDVAVKNKTTGIFGGWFPIANTEKLEYTPKGKIENVISMSEASFGQSFDSEQIPEPGEIAFTVSEMNAQILAMTIAASLSTSTIASGTVTAETHTVSTGDAVLLDKNYVSSLVVKDHLDATLVAGTDYKMISNNHFEVLKAGLVGEELSIAYSYLASEWAVMDMGADNHTIKVRFNGLNRRSGKRVKAFWADITVDSGISLALLSSKFQPFDIKGIVNVDKDATSATYGKIGTLEIEL